jgi:hypothetical protein
MRTLLIITLSFFASSAFAQGVEDLDASASKRKAKAAKEDVVREINKGTYIKGGAGSAQFFGIGGTPYGKILAPVIAMELGFGHEFVDSERFSVAGELDIHQGLFNGPKEDELAGLPPSILIQGDIHTFSVLGALEVSTYPTRRIGVGLRVGGGIMAAPLLMHPDKYNNTVVASYWQGLSSPVHGSPLPMVFGGPALEYYTKLSHFSVGLDIDVGYVIGFDLGMNGTGYLKYTF